MRKQLIFGGVVLTALLFLMSCSKTDLHKNTPSTSTHKEAEITFIELGSVSCIPCKKMQPVMKSIEKRYAGHVNVIFYDVWKDKAPAKKYGIKLIPTQIFLDKDDHELMRHEGFFAEVEIDKFLQAQGLQPKD